MFHFVVLGGAGSAAGTLAARYATAGRSKVAGKVKTKVLTMNIPIFILKYGRPEVAGKVNKFLP